jgi:hypothetical protein
MIWRKRETGATGAAGVTGATEVPGVKTELEKVFNSKKTPQIHHLQTIPIIVQIRVMRSVA